MHDVAHSISAARSSLRSEPAALSLRRFSGAGRSVGTLTGFRKTAFLEPATWKRTAFFPSLDLPESAAPKRNPHYRQLLRNCSLRPIICDSVHLLPRLPSGFAARIPVSPCSFLLTGKLRVPLLPGFSRRTVFPKAGSSPPAAL